MADILVLTPQLPFPAYQGASLRNWHILRGLAERHRVTLLSFLEDNQSNDPALIAPLLALCREVKTVPVPRRSLGRRATQLVTGRLPDMGHRLHSAEFNESLAQLLASRQFDVVQIEGIELARALTIARAIAPQSKVVFDNHNAETELQRRAFLTDLPYPARWPAAVYSFIQTSRLRRFERWICQEADAVTAVSQADRHHLQTLIPGLGITVIPNSLDVQAIQTGVDEVDPVPTDLLFSGKMDYRPNIDAVLWFAETIWPQLVAARPQTTWHIVGQKPHARLEATGRLPGVTLTGWVPGVEPYLAGATVYIMPFRLGSGTRLKLIEAMAAGKAIVSTAAGAEGFAVRHDQELLLAADAEGFATAVAHLLAHPNERARLGQAARRFAQQYDWRHVTPAFDEVYERISRKAP
jgi:polysaccharide biosynthesis protein PslH